MIKNVIAAKITRYAGLHPPRLTVINARGAEAKKAPKLPNAVRSPTRVANLAGSKYLAKALRHDT